ncbi:unnamed protein product [Allacma fusca]|uniref:Uncharacterized protein n=1 Tax=Allacma fusca TaxID=39272 RepID=A0A8J2M2W2_9HEXA|nr:unnamed protein product [Allacma fusca]
MGQIQNLEYKQFTRTSENSVCFDIILAVGGGGSFGSTKFLQHIKMSGVFRTKMTVKDDNQTRNPKTCIASILLAIVIIICLFSVIFYFHKQGRTRTNTHVDLNATDYQSYAPTEASNVSPSMNTNENGTTKIVKVTSPSNVTSATLSSNSDTRGIVPPVLRPGEN